MISSVAGAAIHVTFASAAADLQDIQHVLQ